MSPDSAKYWGRKSLSVAKHLFMNLENLWPTQQINSSQHSWISINITNLQTQNADNYCENDCFRLSDWSGGGGDYWEHQDEDLNGCQHPPRPTEDGVPGGGHGGGQNHIWLQHPDGQHHPPFYLVLWVWSLERNLASQFLPGVF